LANQFYLQDNTGAGPALKAQGANVAVGQFGAWAPIGAEKTANGYEIAWRSGNADQYTLWATDNSGNKVSSLIGEVSGSDSTLQSAETLFQQDLNGDGHLGVTNSSQGGGQQVGTPPIESIGTTRLATSANQFYLEDSTGAGPTLKVQDANVAAGQFGAWIPIGAEKTASGYEIAWKFGSADQYTLWVTDNNGNKLSSLIGEVSGSDPTLQSAETLFQQDFNGDGHLGVTNSVQGGGQQGGTLIESIGATTLATLANQFYLQDNTGAGPTLKSQGINVVAGQYGAWTPIGAEKTANGYEIAWHNASTDQYTLWGTDSNGNKLSSLIGEAPGSDPTLESAETLFQQDLNGDGHFGLI
jgi:hypothetical protein